MPRGRPPKYRTKEEREEMRREQVRLAVKACRQRKQARQSAGGLITPPDESSTTVTLVDNNGTIQSQVERLQHLLKLCSLGDVAEVSSRPRIDLYFDVIPALIQDLDKATVGYPWAEAWSLDRSRDTILDRAVVAGAGRLMASMHNYIGLADVSRVAYHDTILKLQARIRSADPRDVVACGTVMAALANFEVGDGSSRTQGSQWEMHANGIQSLMRAAGPEAFQSPVGLKFLRANRYIAITLALWHPESNFYSEEKWSTIPFLYSGKTKEDKLWDLVFRLPYQFVHAHKLALAMKEGDPSRISKATHNLFESVTNLCLKVQLWAADYHSNPEKLPISKPVNQRSAESPLLPFESSLVYKDLTTAHAHVTCSGLLVQAHLLALNAQEVLHNAGYDELAYTFRPMPDLEQAALDMCRSMQYCLGDDIRDLRGAITCCNTPLQIAIRYFDRDPLRHAKVLEWCKAFADKVARRCLLRGNALKALTRI